MDHAWLNQGTYGVRVRSRDDKNAESGWSESLAVSVVLVEFAPNVSVDHGCSCGSPSIAIGPPTGQTPPIYVAMQDGANIAFQKSTDVGMSWLADNQYVCQGACRDITTDAEGGIYLIYVDAERVYCVHSFDGGSTWSSPARIDDCDSTQYVGWACVAADTAGHLFCAWNDNHHLWTSISTDRGVTWSTDPNTADGVVRSVCVQPGTNHYFVATDDYVYRSRDMGQTFEPGVRLCADSDFSYWARVAADREHVVTGYIGGYGNGVTKVRTLYTTPDTWGPCTSVTDSTHNVYRIALAMSASGRVHTAQMMNRNNGRYDIYYAYSSNHGVAWSAPELVNDDKTGDKWNPDIGTDTAGYAYIVWQDGRASNPGIWFSTNNPAGLRGGLQGRDPKQTQPRGKGRGPRSGTAMTSRLKPHAALPQQASDRLGR